MSNPFIGEIRIFAGNFAPLGWLMCAGQLISIAENDTLFALIGTTYGGDGQTTFGLPNLQSRVPIHASSTFVIGQTGGNEEVTLTTQQLPSHAHPLMTTGQPGTSATPTNTSILADEGPSGATPTIYTPFTGTNQVALRANSVSVVGGNLPHNNIQPYLAINYIISTQGIFPSPS